MKLSARVCILPGFSKDQQKVRRKSLSMFFALEQVFWSFLAERNVSKGFLDIRLQFE
jgi:hypothetical protein